MNVVGKEGSIVMSAYPVSKLLPLNDEERALGITAKVQIYGEDYDGPTGMGAIADAFRHRPETVMGTGIHRVCAWGRDATKHSAGYGYLLEVDGWVLLLGVGIGYCSSMHQAEKVGIPPEVVACVSVPEEIRQQYSEDIYVSYGTTPEDAWQKVLDTADAQDRVKRQQIGTAECLLFKARVVVGIYEHALRTDPLGLFGLRAFDNTI
jgi:aminoglycoside N3'-acetyltransferase